MSFEVASLKATASSIIAPRMVRSAWMLAGRPRSVRMSAKAAIVDLLVSFSCKSIGSLLRLRP